MNSKFFFLGLILIAIASLFLIPASNTPVVKAQSPFAEPVYTLTPTAPSSPTPSSYITPFVSSPGPIVERPFTPTPTFTVQPTLPIANLTGPIQYIPPTNTPTSTPTPTVLPTIGVAGFIPSATPTPSFTYFSFGPKGTPDAKWDTAEELLQSLSNRKTDAFEIDRWYNGGWDTHIKGLPFNNFNIVASQGYLIGVRGKKELNDEKLKYNRLDSISLNIANGWAFISIPQNVSQKSKISNAEDLCNKINKQGGKAVEIDRHPQSSDAGFWNIYTCGKKTNNFDIQSGIGYMVRAEKYTTLSLPK